MYSKLYSLGLGLIVLVAHVVVSATAGKDELVSAGQCFLQTSRRQTTPKAKFELSQYAGAPQGMNGALAQPSPNISSTDLLCELKQVADMSKVISIRNDGERFPSRTYRTCSVVSSSGVLLAHHYGAEIDSAEAVFRFNDAPIQGFEDFVGQKETIRMVNNEIPQQAIEEQSLVIAPKAEHIMTFCCSEKQMNATREFINIFPGTPLYRVETGIPNGLSAMIRNIWDSQWFEGKGFIPTSGLVGMTIALSICDHVKAFGMAASSAMAKAKYHYYDPDDTTINDTPSGNSTALYSVGWPRFNNYHQSFEAEKDMWRLLSTNSTDDGVFDDDVSIIPGFSQIQCEDV